MSTEVGLAQGHAADSRYWTYEVPKRLLDVALALVGLVVLAPFLLLIAAAVRADSPGPALYVTVRSGRGGRGFRMFKFRTMYDGADTGWRTTGFNDPRVTRIGAVLRRYKLDELPQLLNVLRGDMSLVGPRPELPYYTQRYRGEELLILTVRPGLTDLSSIRFRNLSAVVGPADVNRVFEERILPEKNRLRVEYVKRRSLAMDVRLIGQTLYAILRG